MKSSPLRHPVKQARGLGAAKDGVSHWWAQRVTAIAMIPLGTWLIYMLIAMMRTADAWHVQDWLTDPMAAFPLALLLGVMFYHAKLGLQVVIEDYFHAPRLKYTLIILNMFLCFVGGFLSILAIMKLHLSLQTPIW